MSTEMIPDREPGGTRERGTRRRERKAPQEASGAACTGEAVAAPDLVAASENRRSIKPPQVGPAPTESSIGTESRPAPRERAARTAGPGERATGVRSRADRIEGYKLELFGVAVLAVGLLLLLALGSYDLQDVAPQGRASQTGEAANWIGPVGAHIADLLLWLFGGGAFLLTGVLFLVGGLLFFNRKISVGVAQIIGFGLFTISGTMLVHLMLRGTLLLGHLPGGLFGEFIGELARSMLSTVGSIILGWALLVISIMLTTQISLAELCRRAGQGLRHAGQVLRQGLRQTTQQVRERTHDLLRRPELPEILEEISLAPAGAGSAGVLAGGGVQVASGAEASWPEAPSPLARGRRQERGPSDPMDGWSFAGEPEPKQRSSQQRRPAADAPAPSEEWCFSTPAPRSRQDAPAVTELGLGPAALRASREATSLGSAGPDSNGPRSRELPAGPTCAGPTGWDDEEDEDEIEFGAEPEDPADGQAEPDDPDDADDADDAELATPAETLPYVSRREPERGRTTSGPPPTGAPGAGPAIIQPQHVTRELPLDVANPPARPRAEASPHVWELPALSLLDYSPRVAQDLDRQALLDMAGKLEGKLANYGVKGKVREIHPGPVVTMFEFEPGPGIRISKISNLSDDLAMSLEAVRVRIVAPIPGKGVVGIEVPSQRRETVYLKELVADPAFQQNRMRLPLCIGKDIIGFPIVRDLAKMPHLLTAGATGSGKSVLVNCMVVSLLYRYSPEDLRMIMVDPKQLEFALYEGIPHLLLPVVTDPKKAAAALKWAVAEMERRYSLMAEAGVRNLADYNRWIDGQRAALHQSSGPRRSIVLGAEPEAARPIPLPDLPEKIPSIVVIIDEFAELMMVASKDVETSVCRLAQKARASGIHLILATQRPSVDVITGVIKANFPARIGLQVAQREDSRTILGQNGAENLLGDGDMLIMSPGASGLTRAHGPLVTDEEIKRVCDHWRNQGHPHYDMDIISTQEKEGDAEEEAEEEQDEMYDMAVHVVAEARLASASMLQRRLRIGYNRAARLVEIMEREGVVGPADGARPREVLVPPPLDL